MSSLAIAQPARFEPIVTAPQIYPWTEVHAWLDLLPMLFITVGGWIQAGTGPVAFRFTALAEDSLERRLVRIAFSLLIVLLISTRFKRVMELCRRERAILVMPAIAFISLLWSQNRGHTLADAINLALSTLFAVYLYGRYPNKRLLSFLVFAAGITLLMCVASVIVTPSVGIDSFQQDAWRGVFGQRNNCAVVCVLFLLVSLHYQSRTLTERMVRGGVLVVSSVFILMSGSRTGWLLAGLTLALTFGLRLIQRMGSLDRIVLLVGLTLPFAILIGLVALNFNQALALIGKDPTLTQRTVIWSEVIPSIAERPFQGYGYSAFWMGLNGESERAVLATGWMEGQAQDGYLDVLLGLGVVGFVPLCWMFCRGLVQAWRTIQANAIAPQIQLAIVLLIAVMAQNIGETSILLPLGIPWFYAVLAFLILAFATKDAEVL
jgi:exopolysaccharide production protein ExoQ